MEEKLQRRLVVVSNRLPFQLLEKNKKITLKESDGGLVSALKSYFESTDNSEGIASKWWIGSAEFPEKRWRSFSAGQKKKGFFEVEPIFLDKKIYNKFYNGFCNAT